jgi:hypothetical protein
LKSAACPNVCSENMDMDKGVCRLIRAGVRLLRSELKEKPENKERITDLENLRFKTSWLNNDIIQYGQI